MSEKTVVVRMNSTLLWTFALLVSSAHPFAQAAQRTWTGLGADASWSTSGNWDSGVPVAADTALFSGTGNGKTAITLGSGATATALNFAADASAYTVGLTSETLTSTADLALTVAAGVANNQSIAAKLLVGNNLNVYNNEPSKSLTLNYTNSANRVIYIYGSGPVTFDTLRRPAGSELSNNNTIDLQIRTAAPITCTGPISLGDVWKDSAYPPSELILAPHTTNIICRDSWDFALSGGTISGGEGTVLRLARATTSIPAAIAVQTANPVTISCRLECPSGLATLNAGANGWARGTLVLSYSDNLISNAVTINAGNCVQVPFLALNGTPNPLGSCTNFNFTNPLDSGIYARLRVTGSSASASDKTFTVDKDCAVIENAGSGLITLSGSLCGNGAFIFDGVGPLTLSGVCSTTGGITKVGSGTLTFAATNTYRGVTAVNGGTLAIANGGTPSTNQIILAGGTTLSLNPAAAADFSLTLPPVVVTAPASLVVAAPSSGSSSVTFPSLTVTNTAVLSVTAPDAGASNRIFISGLADGFVPWITLNGSLASYSSVTGLIPFTATATSHIATLGPSSVIPDGSTGSAVIDTEGSSGPITLAAGLTSVAILSQEYPTGALADFGGGILAANLIRQSSGAGALTLRNGFLTANGANSNACIAGVGTLSVAIVTNDEATGISPSKTYTHLLDFGTSTSNATINGVALNKVSTSSGTFGSYGWSGFPAGGTYYNWTDWSNNIPVTAGLRNMLYDMVYSGSDATLKLTGLTPGATYEVRYYLRTWDGRTNPIERTARYDFLTDAAAGPAASTVFDMNHSYPSAIIFRYVAATSELTIKTYCAANTSNPYPGFFGITNEKLADAPVGLPTGRAGLAFVTAGTEPITVSAAVVDNGRATSLTKEGSGTLTLSGPVSITGGTALNGGTLDLAPTSGVTQLFASSIAGAGAVVKRDAGTTLFMGANAYSGLTIVSNGTLAVAHSNALGFASAGTLVISNAALSLASAEVGWLNFAEPITFAGAGPDGLGAVRNDSPSPQLYAFKNLALSGPGTIGGTAALSGFPYSIAPSASGRFDLRSGTLDFAGFPLTKAGPGGFFITSSSVTGVTAGAAIDIAGGVLGLESTTTLQGSDANILSVRSGTSLDLYQLVSPVRWSLLLENQARLTARSGATNQNIVSGPVNLTGTAILDGTTYDTLSGTISGSGGLLKAQGYTRLSGTNNLYAGATTITNGTLFALADTTLPGADFSRVFVLSNGVLVVRPAGVSSGQPGWSDSSLDALVSSGAFPSRTAALGFETVYGDHTYAGTLPVAGVQKYGPKKETITSTSVNLGPITVYEGELNFTTAAHNIGTNSIFVGPDSTYPSVATLHVSNASSLLTSDLGYNRSGPLVSVGAANATRGVLYLEDGSVAGRLYLGGGYNNAQGAVYQTGGTFLNTAGSGNDGRLGANGSGYYEISGGTFTTKGYTQLGYNTNTVGIIRQTGGSIVFNSGTVPATGVVADYYGGNFAVRAGFGLFNLAGGTFNTGTAKLSLGEYDSVYTYSNGVGVLTVENDAYATADYLEMANRNGAPLSVAALNGGDLAVRYVVKGGNNSNGTNATALVSFNGGNLRLTDSGAAIRSNSSNTVPVLAVGTNGASIEVDASRLSTLDLPLAPPQGLGVTYMAVNGTGAGYIAPPFVYISGGGGTGATAVASINRTSGLLTDIRVTSPGFGYTNAPTVYLLGGGYTTAGSVKDITIGLTPATGGLTKRGNGLLTLTTNNTFRGSVTVAGGTLAARAPAAIPQGANLVLSGGTLDLGGYVLTNSSVTLAGGSLINGSVVTTTLSKNGSGSADLSANITLATVAANANNGTPGLYEGRLTNRLNRTEANPRWSVQLTTRAYNVTNAASGGTINGCQWPDNTCYVYSGYLWNRTGTNVTWTFGENFDDNVYLAIDGNSILDEGNASVPSYRNVLLTPGPHAFEVRCGQSSGTVGGNWVYSNSTYRVGFGVDFQGRAQNIANNYQPLTDPGDGSLLTIDLPTCYTSTVVSAAGGLPSLPSEVASNVGSLASGYALVYASDIPSSGGIINGTVAGTRYSTDNSRTDTNDFDRVAYYVELTHPTYGNQWVWVSFDAVTRDRSRIGYPYHDFAAGTNYSANIFQRKVSNMDVRSNVSTITNYVGCATGNIEFWPTDYSQADYLGLGGSSTNQNSGYDFSDTKSNGALSSTALSGAGHGSFQVHNWGDKTTLFALSNWGNGNNNMGIGIGNQPGSSSGTSLAPDWTFANNGSSYTYRRLYVFTRDIVRTPKSATADVAGGSLNLSSSSIAHPVPQDIRSKVGSAADNYDMVYASALPVTANTIVSGTAYNFDYSSGTAPFSRVAYFLELVKSNVYQYVWVSFDAHTQDRKKLGFPSQTGNLFMWQQKVSNMDVVCNVSGITNYTGCATGNIEIWPSNYGTGTNTAASLLLGGSNTAFDYDDSGANATQNGHGCFQIHNWGDKTTLLAVSHCGATGNTLGIGIGNNIDFSKSPGNVYPDWTFSDNAAVYTVRNLYVFVKPTSLSTGYALSSVDLTVAAGATLDLGGVTQVVQSVTGSGTISNGVLAATTFISPAGDGVVGTLSLAGISLIPGVQYRADLGDLLNVSGALDLTGLHIRINNPEALVRSQTYTLIQTTGGLSGAATLDTALPSGWKLKRDGNNLVLFAESGTILKIR